MQEINTGDHRLILKSFIPVNNPTALQIELIANNLEIHTHVNNSTNPLLLTQELSNDLDSKTLAIHKSTRLYEFSLINLFIYIILETVFPCFIIFLLLNHSFFLRQ